jgi:hypothetical protein
MSKLVFSAAVAAGLILSSAFTASALDRRVVIVNNTSYTITEFYASSVGVDSWEEDILGTDVLPSGAQVRVNVDDGTGYCKYDFKAVFDDGDEAVKKGVNVCEIGTFTFND